MKLPLTNYHSHSTFCDGRAPIEEFVLAAIDAGFSAWGVSSHSPLPMLDHAPWAINIADVDRYIAEINRLKSVYGDRIKILAGLEIDYIDNDYNPANDYFQSLPLDFRIGSVHLLRSPKTGELIDVDCGVDEFTKSIDNHFGGSLQKVVEAYYRALNEMVDLGGFDFVGHPDKISSNATTLSRHITERDWYKALVDEFFEHCAEKRVTLEINTKAYETKGLFFPDRRYFDRIKELGIEVVVNSDAHRVERIATGLEEARQYFAGSIRQL